ncbi:hypothetical protein NEMBOFW57_008842 [Staphylotrichum longicolle]|uniref:Uncharacterized protein n=1 Tax=Staphylotrichum longicolle TaxID=669026 RepID=A0AAD4HX07_9PEZI|nr:hypothetical protein NEMBOFW57_008842 [Staphylotrichum longicolle]
MQLSIRATAISAFALRLHALITLWSGEWMITLRQFESELDVRVTDILSRKKRRKLMYDDSDLAVSELYFFISQMLRFASEWIQESIDDLHALGKQIESKHFSPEAKKKDPEGSFLPDDPDAQTAVLDVFRQNWKSLTSTQRELADELLRRIKKMQEEVNSLREGLFTATAVSEATKSKQLNHYILVFTVVTIFYLPLSFVAALYALDLFSWDDPNQKVSFVVTLILVAGTTYGFAGYLVWFVRKPKRRQRLKNAKRVKSLGKLFKRQRKKDGSGSDIDSEDSDSDS